MTQNVVLKTEELVILYCPRGRTLEALFFDVEYDIKTESKNSRIQLWTVKMIKAKIYILFMGAFVL